MAKAAEELATRMGAKEQIFLNHFLNEPRKERCPSGFAGDPVWPLSNVSCYSTTMPIDVSPVGDPPSRMWIFCPRHSYQSCSRREKPFPWDT